MREELVWTNVDVELMLDLGDQRLRDDALYANYSYRLGSL